MTINKSGVMDELEKAGDVEILASPWHRVQIDSRATWSRCRTKDPLLYYKIMLSFFLGFVLWQHALLILAYPSPCTQSHCARQVADIPSYVLEYAPVVWLDEAERYFPSDIAAQLENTHPDVNFSIITEAPSPLTLENLDALNDFGDNGTNVYLTSTIDVTTNPTWLEGIVPDSTGKTNGATSCIIITTDHGAGLVDAFYMYFYAYNQGNTVLGKELGDHIGDWEHNMVRFQDGVPKAIWYSQHSSGQAFTYSATEKVGIRPVSYSARGSHANYATAGSHDHTLPDFHGPIGLLLDYTSQGTLWDPTLEAYFYTYDPATDSFASSGSVASPLGAILYKGRWGDEEYPQSDPRQGEPFFGFTKFVGGPTGPRDKRLNRKNVCPEDDNICLVHNIKLP
ncbi:vacuolar protein sorting-associated protein 62 [Phlyctema vagabunda]|uniref:Vacuolar protein sorting-associated protein 62 n=1 Tax=Phlyctema vagabunda TaxID=108571 RepID=A0ABR4PRR9_9HELO